MTRCGAKQIHKIKRISRQPVSDSNTRENGIKAPETSKQAPVSNRPQIKREIQTANQHQGESAAFVKVPQHLKDPQKVQ